VTCAAKSPSLRSRDHVASFCFSSPPPFSTLPQPVSFCPAPHCPAHLLIQLVIVHVGRASPQWLWAPTGAVDAQPRSALPNSRSASLPVPDRPGLALRQSHSIAHALSHTACLAGLPVRGAESPRRTMRLAAAVEVQSAVAGGACGKAKVRSAAALARRLVSPRPRRRRLRAAAPRPFELLTPGPEQRERAVIASWGPRLLPRGSADALRCTTSTRGIVEFEKRCSAPVSTQQGPSSCTAASVETDGDRRSLQQSAAHLTLPSPSDLGEISHSGRRVERNVGPTQGAHLALALRAPTSGVQLEEQLRI